MRKRAAPPFIRGACDGCDSRSITAICNNCRAQSVEESANSYLQQLQGSISGGKRNGYLYRRKTTSSNFETLKSKRKNRGKQINHYVKWQRDTSCAPGGKEALPPGAFASKQAIEHMARRSATTIKRWELLGA